MTLTISSQIFLRIVFTALICLMVIHPAAGQCGEQQGSKAEPAKKRQRREDAEQRAESLRNICRRLDVGTGDAVVDIGAGRGRDTWVFAEIVGESGKVYSEEIEEDKVAGLRKAVEGRDLKQVEPVLGTPTSLNLADESVDMAFMHFVYHHMSKPREMLRSIWKTLKPGGYMVIVDQRKGTLVDWVPREERARKHYWIAETTVVREARETGFVFVDYLDKLWHAKSSFVLVFQRPKGLDAPDRDPDAASELPGGIVSDLLPHEGEPPQRVAFVALGEGRSLIAPLLKATSAEAMDIILEEWATQKSERPETPGDVEIPSLLTEQGDPQLDSKPLDAVYFLDTYHLLFHGPKLLSELRARLAEDGLLYVLDRPADQEMPHREASHRRMIPPELVEQEMKEAGFRLRRSCPKVAEDRFLMVFEKTKT